MIKAKQSNPLGKTLISLKPNSTQIIIYRDTQPRDAFVVVMGPTGSGKSSFVNNCSGTDAVVVGHDLMPGKLRCFPCTGLYQLDSRNTVGH